jgi:hypothetical protein
MFTLGVDTSFAQQPDLSAEAPQDAKAEAAAWRQVADAIPLGSKVKVQLVDGKRISGTLMRADSAGIFVKRNARRPEPAIAINLDDVSRLERDHSNGVNVGKAIAVGLAAGAGVILGMFFIALQLD